MTSKLGLLLLTIVGGAAGACGTWLASVRLPPAPELHDLDFRVDRPGGEPFEVTPDRPLQIPYDFGDFDLFAEVELPAHGELDMLVRKVEPTRRLGDMPLFHGRFAVLRLSTRAAGPAWRTRESALFDAPSGGQLLEAGRRASVVLIARGRDLRANIAGVWLPTLEATDAHGDLAFAVRGGTALIHLLEIRRVARPLRLLPWAWGGLCAALIGLLLALSRSGARSRARAAWGALAVPAGGLLAGLLVLSHVVPESEPHPVSLVAAGSCGVPVWIAVALRSGWIGRGVAVVAALLALELTARLERPRLHLLEDPRLDLYFGWDSGTAPADALMNRLRARTAVHTARPAPRRVMFAGGGMLYESGDVGQFLGPLSAAAAARELGTPIDAVVVPTVYSHTLQQLVLLRRFYLDAFRPDVVVFGVPPWEGEPIERARPRDVLLGRYVPPSGFGSVLLELWRSAAAARDVAPSDGPSLRATLDELAELSASHGFRVLVVDDPTLAEPLRTAVRAAVRQHGFAHLRAPWIIGGDVEVEPLARALTELLRE